MLALEATAEIVDVARVVIGKLLKFGGRLVGMFEALINKEIRLPFVSALYEKVVGSKMTVLSALALLLAVPVTTAYKLLTGEAPFPFVEVAPMAFAADTAAGDGLSTDPKYDNAPTKPRTYGIEAMIGAAGWTALLAVVGAAGLAAHKVLAKLASLIQALCERLSQIWERIFPDAMSLGTLVSRVTSVLYLLAKVGIYLGTAIWYIVNTIRSGAGVDRILLFARWGVSGLGVLAAVLAAIDPTQLVGPALQLLGSVIDTLLGLAYGGVLIAQRVRETDYWMIGVDLIGMACVVIDLGGSICSFASKYNPEAASKGVLWGISLATTVFTGGMRAVLVSVPFILDRSGARELGQGVEA
jgi:hypothetical protein